MNAQPAIITLTKYIKFIMLLLLILTRVSGMQFNNIENELQLPIMLAVDLILIKSVDSIYYRII